MDNTNKKILFGFGSIDKVSQFIGKTDDDNVYFSYDDTSNSGIIVARGKLVSSSILDVYVSNNSSSLGKVINVDYMSVDNTTHTLQIPVVDEDDIADVILNLESDYTGDKSVTDSSNFVRIAMKQEEGIITYLNVETDDIASKKDLDALTKRLDDHIKEHPDVEGFAVSYIIPNVESSNSSNSVNSGDNFVTLLTPKEGYKITSIKVTMNGSDISSLAVISNIVNITNVTGDIVIKVETELITFTVKSDFIDGVTIKNPVSIIGYNQNITLELELQENYSLSKSNITVLQDNEKRDFTYNSDNNTIIIDSVKGNIVYSIDCAAVYTITRIFNNVTCSNETDTITDQDSYENTLIIDSSKYKSVQVTVTINDEDVTYSVYNMNTFTIKIDVPYGNIVIHAEATNVYNVDLETQIDLTKNKWKFMKLRDASSETFDSEMVKTSFDDSGWNTITVPHDWSIYNSFATNISGNEYESGWLAGGDAVYRTTFNVPSQYIGNKIYIHFDGVYMISDVFINGNPCGKNVNGYIPFSYDITNYVNKGNNTLAVQVSNHVPSSRWYSGSGIFRDCWISMNNVKSIGTADITVTTPNLQTEVGSTVTTNIDLQLQNTTTSDITAKEIIVNIYQEWNSTRVATQTVTNQTLTANSTTDVNISVGVKNPNLWTTHDKSDNIYLYNVVCVIKYTESDLDYYVYTNKELFGYRYISYDANGFYLNGEKTFLKGTCNHHDNGILGAETNYSATEHKLRILKEMGCNTLRCTHNPESREFIECATKMGFMVIEELFDGWRYPKNSNVYDYSRFFSQDDSYIEVVVKNVINRDKNIPSIIMWSIGNEVDEQTTQSFNDTYVSDGKKIVDYIKKYDTTRPTTFGNNKPENGYARQIMAYVDIPGINYGNDSEYSNLRVNTTDCVNFSNKCIYGSETTSAFYTRGIYETSKANNYYTCFDYSNSEKATSHADWGDSTYIALKRHMNSISYLAGMMPWTGLDYIGEPTPSNNYSVRSSFFGAVDLCGFPKDVYYLYQAYWTTTPMIHIVPEDWSIWAEGSTIPVWIYTNCDNVKLHMNGEEVTPTVTPKTGSHYAYEYSVTYKSGTLVATAYDSENNIIAQDVRYSTNKVQSKIKLYSDKVSVDKNSYIFIEANVCDNYGTIIPRGDLKVKFTCQGAEVIGTDNGFPGCLEPIRNNIQSMFTGKCLAVIKPNGIDKVVTVKCESTEDATVNSSIDIILSSHNVYTTKKKQEYIDPENPPLHTGITDFILSNTMISVSNGETAMITVTKVPSTAIDTIYATSTNKNVNVHVNQNTNIITVYTTSKNIYTEIVIVCGLVKKSVTVIFGSASIDAPTLTINDTPLTDSDTVYKYEYCKYSFSDDGREIKSVTSSSTDILTIDTTNKILHGISDGDVDIKLEMLDGTTYTYSLKVATWKDSNNNEITTEKLLGCYANKLNSAYNYEVNDYIYDNIIIHCSGKQMYVVLTFDENAMQASSNKFTALFGYDKTGKRKAYIAQFDPYNNTSQSRFTIGIGQSTAGKVYIEAYNANEAETVKWFYAVGSLPCTDIILETTNIDINSDLDNDKSINYTIVPSNTTDNVSFTSTNGYVNCTNGALYALRSGTDIVTITCGSISKQVTININNVTEDDTIIVYNMKSDIANRIYYSPETGIEWSSDKTIYMEFEFPQNVPGSSNIVSFGSVISQWAGTHYHIYYPTYPKAGAGNLSTSEVGLCIAMSATSNTSYMDTYGITKDLVGDNKNLVRIIQNSKGIYINGVNSTLINKNKSQVTFDTIQNLTRVYIGSLEGTTGFDGVVKEIRVFNDSDLVDDYTNTGLTEELMKTISTDGFDKYTYLKIWKSSMDSLVGTLDMSHENSQLLKYGYLKSMSIGNSVQVMFVNPHKDNGYILGYNGSTIGYSTGFTDMYDIQDKIEELIDQSNTSYIFNLIKTSDDTYNIKLINEYGPTGTTDKVTWSTTLIEFTIKDNSTTNISVDSLCEEYPDDTVFTITNPDGYSLNTQGSPSLIKFSDNLSEWSLWNIFKVKI